MAALRIFISHSARPRDSAAGDAQAQANWRLLQETCAALAAQYGNAIDILVDYDGLQPGDRWEQCLDEWLYDCHAAILLLSRRAVGDSNWVRKEATILSWRAAIEPGFRLFPVLLDGQTPADLDRDEYFRMLGISRDQCVQSVAGAPAILAGVKPRLDDRLARAGAAQTPFERLVTAVETILDMEVKEVILSDLWSKHFPGTQPPLTHLDPRQRFARGLAGYLFSEGGKALERFSKILDGLVPRPGRERAEEMLKYIRALWVDVGAAGVIASARSHGKCLAMNGQLVAKPDVKLKVDCFTLRRHLERAWPATDQIKVIQVSQLKNADEIWQEVRQGYWPGEQRPPARVIDAELRKDTCHLIVLLPTPAQSGEAPDPLLLPALEDHARQRQSLTFVVHVGERLPVDLPGDLRPVLPELGEDTEWTQYLQELKARDLINTKYESMP
ncbi:MAG: toll/interleukin-1 receptor domain-containing protein [Candidatus Accumulibacter sp.]|uniref:toll/interleukin-1 receptor domain-containing protein n=1 Tax=Accumulibacter sp. TaxID=2053492 RepID=UPI001A563F37|nr:toll/interleukin-1 receptor domain-containing protein [Accumulibacter sp.]MBL8394085.1 toll/interleukin-1 receptor domain-containing protein [Accumulibacter sp.]